MPSNATNVLRSILPRDILEYCLLPCLGPSEHEVRAAHAAVMADITGVMKSYRDLDPWDREFHVVPKRLCQTCWVTKPSTRPFIYPFDLIAEWGLQFERLCNGCGVRTYDMWYKRSFLKGQSFDDVWLIRHCRLGQKMDRLKNESITREEGDEPDWDSEPI